MNTFRPSSDALNKRGINRAALGCSISIVPIAGSNVCGVALDAHGSEAQEF
jgi:hypothetical protein